MLGASVAILDQLLELSVTGDTAKYLVLTLSRGCARSPLDLTNPNYPHTPIVIGEKKKVKTRSFGSIFPPHTGLTRSNLQSSTTTCQAGVSPRNLFDQDRAHMTNGCTGSNLHLEFFRSLCSWVAIHK